MSNYSDEREFCGWGDGGDVSSGGWFQRSYDNLTSSNLLLLLIPTNLFVLVQNVMVLLHNVYYSVEMETTVKNIYCLIK